MAGPFANNLQDFGDKATASGLDGYPGGGSTSVPAMLTLQVRFRGPVDAL